MVVRDELLSTIGKANMNLRCTLIFTSVLLVSSTPANAWTGCDEARINDDFEEISLKSLEYLLLPTPLRALCGHPIIDDVRFWESMTSHYNCTKDSGLADFLRHHWGKSIENRRQLFDAQRLKHPEPVETMCLEVGELRYPEVYSLNGLMEVARQISVSPTLLPK